MSALDNNTKTTLRTVVKRATTPRSQIKTVRWRGDVVSVVNKYFARLNYQLIPPEPAVGQEWFWSQSWQKSMTASMAAIEAGKGRVFENSADFLASLDE